MNDFKPYYPEPLNWETPSNQNKPSGENINTPSDTASSQQQKNSFNLENLLAGLGNNPNDMLSTLLTKNFLGGKSQSPIFGDLMANIFSTNKKTQQKSTQETTYEEF